MVRRAWPATKRRPFWALGPHDRGDRQGHGCRRVRARGRWPLGQVGEGRLELGFRHISKVMCKSQKRALPVAWYDRCRTALRHRCRRCPMSPMPSSTTRQRRHDSPVAFYQRARSANFRRAEQHPRDVPRPSEFHLRGILYDEASLVVGAQEIAEFVERQPLHLLHDLDFLHGGCGGGETIADSAHASAIVPVTFDLALRL
jgi:hypothetical protein